MGNLQTWKTALELEEVGLNIFQKSIIIQKVKF